MPGRAPIDRIAGVAVKGLLTAQSARRAVVLLRALDKVGPDPQKIRDTLEEVDDFAEAVTKMKPHPFTHENHESLDRQSGFLAVWRDGKLVRAE